jgi:ribonuclease Z
VSFTLVILGSSSALPTSERFPTAQVLNVQERFFLIDCGEGTQIQLRKYNIRLGRLNHIFISHLHGDHVFGLFGLLSSLGLMGRSQEMHIYGPPDLAGIVSMHFKAFDIHLPYEITFHSLDCDHSQRIFEDRAVEVICFPVKHRIPACGFLFREKERLRKFKPGIFEKYDIPVAYRKGIQRGKDFTLPDGRILPNDHLTNPGVPSRSYAFCGDTRYHRGMISSIRNVDMMYHEATFSDEDAHLAEITGHSTARQAGKIAHEAHVGKLIIGHFSARYKDLEVLKNEARQEFENTFLAVEGKRFTVPLVK